MNAVNLNTNDNGNGNGKKVRGSINDENNNDLSQSPKSKMPPFESHMTLQDAFKLKIHDKIDHRDQVGRFVFATVSEKQGTWDRLPRLAGSHESHYTQKLPNTSSASFTNTPQR